MKRVVPLLLSFICLAAFTATAQNSGGKKYFTDIEVTTSADQTPQFSAGGVVNIGGKPRKWIVILVKFRPAKVAARSGSGMMWRDDVSIQFEALFVNKGNPSLLSTKIDYWAVQFDGEESYAIAFINPTIFERFSPPGAKVKKDSVPVRATFLINEAPVAVAYGGSKSQEAAAAEFKEYASSPNVNRVPNAILGKEQTPWSVLNFDAFELTKQTGK